MDFVNEELVEVIVYILVINSHDVDMHVPDVLFKAFNLISTFFNFDEYQIKQKLLQLYSGDYVLVWGEPDEDG